MYKKTYIFKQYRFTSLNIPIPDLLNDAFSENLIWIRITIKTMYIGSRLPPLEP